MDLRLLVKKTLITTVLIRKKRSPVKKATDNLDVSSSHKYKKRGSRGKRYNRIDDEKYLPLIRKADLAKEREAQLS